MVRPLIAIALILAALTAFFYLRKPAAFVPKPLTWEECLKTPGASMLLTYPGQCVTPDGRRVTQPISEEDKKKLQPPSNPEGTCILDKDYQNTAVNPISCRCPSGYKMKIVSMSMGPCPEPGMRDCPASIQRCVIN